MRRGADLGLGLPGKEGRSSVAKRSAKKSLRLYLGSVQLGLCWDLIADIRTMDQKSLEKAPQAAIREYGQREFEADERRELQQLLEAKIPGDHISTRAGAGGGTHWW